MSDKLFSRADIDALPQRFRAAMINSISGFKSANLIGTADEAGNTNLSIVSSVVHLGANPPLLGMVMRPPVVPRHTYENILKSGVYTINHVHADIVQQAHQTSASYDKTQSEFEEVGLTAAYRDGFKAPHVAEANIRMGMRFVREIEITENNTRFIIGEIEWLELPEAQLADDGYVNIEGAGTVAVSALDGYHSTQHLGRMSYAKPDTTPERLTEVLRGFAQ
jgi:flavin reductase (DIM6/NTAB) family NADH-FMN oxidoreductase RutF